MLDFTAIKYSNIFKRPPNKASRSTRLSGFTTELETPARPLCDPIKFSISTDLWFFSLATVAQPLSRRASCRNLSVVPCSVSRRRLSACRFAV